MSDALEQSTGGAISVLLLQLDTEMLQSLSSSISSWLLLLFRISGQFIIAFKACLKGVDILWKITSSTALILLVVATHTLLSRLGKNSKEGDIESYKQFSTAILNGLSGRSCSKRTHFIICSLKFLNFILP